MTHGPVEKLLGMNIVRRGERGTFHVSLRDHCVDKIQELLQMEDYPCRTLKAPALKNAVLRRQEGELQTTHWRVNVHQQHGETGPGQSCAGGEHSQLRPY